VEESLGAIKAYVDRGAIRHVGVSAVSVAQLEQARTVVDITVNAIKLAWLLRRSPVVLPIPGTRSIEHLRENLAALEIDLGDVAA
jgi:pyridoxine 4-dehydrogenase